MTETHLATKEGSSASIDSHGANLLSWRTVDGRERLFLSRTARRETGCAIRGGVPVIFPQFGGTGPLRHGFARVLNWSLVDATESQARFALESSQATLERWPHHFRLEMTYQLTPNRLLMTLCVTNTGSDAFQFTCALHTYLRISDLGETTVLGLHNRSYHDEVTRTSLVDSDQELRFSGLVDRVYAGVARTGVSLQSGAGMMDVVSKGFEDLVVWNPGAAAAASLPDLHPSGYREFVCIESAMIQNPPRLSPWENWSGSQALSLRH